MKSTLGMLARTVGGRLAGGDVDFEGVATDSRKLHAHQLFVALRGPNFDGHEFITQAAAKGAAAALVERETDAALPQVVVGDVLHALGAFAAAWRLQYPLPLVGVTGSNGKTTVKEMIASILRRRGPVLATRGNLNNEIGLPLTLLELDDTHTAAVIEMGANHAGEIERLAGIARPDVGVITNAGPAHLEGFGSVEGVARAKGELLAALPASGCAVINAGDPFAPLWRDLAADCGRVEFALDTDAEFSARSGEVDVLADGTRQFTLHAPGGARRVRLPLAGLHNVENALAAAAAAVAAGASLDEVVDGLACVRGVGARMQRHTASGGAVVLDDSYNANPASLAVALQVLSAQPGRHWLALGDMGELGADAVALHRSAGQQARDSGVERLFALGEFAARAAEAFGQGAAAFDSMERLTTAVLEDIAADVCLLVKGSRAMRMERLVLALCPDSATGTGD